VTRSARGRTDHLTRLYEWHRRRAGSRGETARRAADDSEADDRPDTELELLHELMPSATSIALLVNPAVPALAEPIARASQPAAQALGLKLHLVHANSERDFESAFADLIQLHVDALVIAPDNLFTAHSEQLGALTLRHALPAVYEFRQFAAAGGLMSYGSSETEYYRLIGTYVGRILKGDKPADLPVQQSTTFELVINLKTAKALGLTVPQLLLTRADEVIE